MPVDVPADADPYSLDFTAPKARQYTWFIDFVDELPDTLSQSAQEGLAHLQIDSYPGLHYGKALARWHKEEDAKESHDQSTHDLQHAILKYPLACYLLLQKLQSSIPAELSAAPNAQPESGFSYVTIATSTQIRLITFDARPTVPSHISSCNSFRIYTFIVVTLCGRNLRSRTGCRLLCAIRPRLSRTKRILQCPSVCGYGVRACIPTIPYRKASSAMCSSRISNHYDLSCLTRSSIRWASPSILCLLGLGLTMPTSRACTKAEGGRVTGAQGEAKEARTGQKQIAETWFAV